MWMLLMRHQSDQKNITINSFHFKQSAVDMNSIQVFCCVILLSRGRCDGTSAEVHLISAHTVIHPPVPSLRSRHVC